MLCQELSPPVAGLFRIRKDKGLPLPQISYRGYAGLTCLIKDLYKLCRTGNSVSELDPSVEGLFAIRKDEGLLPLRPCTEDVDLQLYPQLTQSITQASVEGLFAIRKDKGLLPLRPCTEDIDIQSLHSAETVKNLSLLSKGCFASESISAAVCSDQV